MHCTTSTAEICVPPLQQSMFTVLCWCADRAILQCFQQILGFFCDFNLLLFSFVFLLLTCLLLSAVSPSCLFSLTVKYYQVSLVVNSEIISCCFDSLLSLFCCSWTAGIWAVIKCHPFTWTNRPILHSGVCCFFCSWTALFLGTVSCIVLYWVTLSIVSALILNLVLNQIHFF